MLFLHSPWRISESSQSSQACQQHSWGAAKPRGDPAWPCIPHFKSVFLVFFFPFICFHCHLPPPFTSPRTLSKVFSSPGGTMAHSPVSRPPSCSLACVSRTTHLGTRPPLGTPAQPEHGSPPSPDPTALPSEPPPLPEGRRRWLGAWGSPCALWEAANSLNQGLPPRGQAEFFLYFFFLSFIVFFNLPIL